MSYLLSVMAYLENTSMLNVSQGGLARMLRESLGMLHMDFVSLIKSLSSFLMFGTGNRATYRRHIRGPCKQLY